METQNGAQPVEILRSDQPDTGAKALAQVQHSPAPVRMDFTTEMIETIKATVAVGATDAELQMFLHYARRTGLDPLARQIYFIVRGKGDKRRATIQTGIDGLLLTAERSRQFEGHSGYEWCDAEGNWRDVWLSRDEPPTAARVTVFRSGRRPLTVVAHWHEYVQLNFDGVPNEMWAKMGAQQLGKCALALGLRHMFPQELSGVHSDEEMGQADNPEAGQQRSWNPPAVDAQRATAPPPGPSALPASSSRPPAPSSPSSAPATQEDREKAARRALVQSVCQLYQQNTGRDTKDLETFGDWCNRMLQQDPPKLLGAFTVEDLGAISHRAEVTADLRAEAYKAAGNPTWSDLKALAQRDGITLPADERMVVAPEWVGLKEHFGKSPDERERDHQRKRWFALYSDAGGANTPEASREALSKLLGKPVPQKRDLTAADWKQAADLLFKQINTPPTGPVPPPQGELIPADDFEDPFADDPKPGYAR